MKCIFATVGTTSFDSFIQSICSMPFLTATVQSQQQNNRRQLSDPSASSLESTSDQQLPWQLCEIRHFSKSSHSTQSSSGFLQHSSFDALTEDSSPEDSAEIVIQYGRGRCPIDFFPPEIGEAINYDAADDEGHLSISFATKDETAAKNQFIMHIRWYRFKPSLTSDMERADLILCHAGAGTLLEALSLPKRPDPTTITADRSHVNLADTRVINAIINSTLMDNHQSELAEELEKRSHILVTKDIKVLNTFISAQNFWNNVNHFVPKPFIGGCGNDKADGRSSFQQIVDRVMGV